MRTSLIFSSVKLLQSKTQSLLPGVGGVSTVISCQNYTHYLPMALMFVYKGHFTHSKFKPNLTNCNPDTLNFRIVFTCMSQAHNKDEVNMVWQLFLIVLCLSMS